MNRGLWLALLWPALAGAWEEEPALGLAGQKPVSSQAARTDRRGMLKKASIEKKISPHQLHSTDVPHRLNAGAERVDIQTLLGHSTINTTQIDTGVTHRACPQLVEK